MHWTYRNLIMLNSIAGFETDGAMLHLRRDVAGTVIAGCAVDATYVDPIARRSLDKPGLITFG